MEYFATLTVSQFHAMEIAKYIFPNQKMCLFKFQNICVLIREGCLPLDNVFVQIAEYICPNQKIYLLKLLHYTESPAFSLIPIFKTLVSDIDIVGVSGFLVVHLGSAATYNFQIQLSKLQNVFVQISKCICASSLWATLCAVITSIPFHELPLR